MLSLLASLVLSTAWALEPGQPVTITLQDGTVVSGVVTSSSTAQPQLGLGAPQPGQPIPPTQTGTYIGVPVIPVQPLTHQQRQQFLRKQAAEREARRHEPTTPTSDWQFDLQQALDRQAHGLPFNGK